MKPILLAALLFCLPAAPAAADEPFRLDEALNAPDWLTLSGETRVRYESLGGTVPIRPGGRRSTPLVSNATAG